MQYISAYLLIIIIFSIFIAIRKPEENFSLFWFILIWPVTIIMMIIVAYLDYINYNMDVQKNNKWFGFRKPNDSWPGFAITICNFELQLWKKR